MVNTTEDASDLVQYNWINLFCDLVRIECPESRARCEIWSPRCQTTF